MKRYRMPVFVLLAATALLLSAMLKSFHRASEASGKLSTERSAVDLARLDLTRTQQAARAAEAKSAPADHFLALWQPEIAANSNIEQIFGQLDTLAVNNLLSPSGKNFTVKPNYFFNGRQLTVENVNISVTGDFYRTLNWLGAVEHAFPLARVEQISYTNSGSSLALAVQFVFPRKFDSP